MSVTLIQTRRINTGKGHKYLLDGEEADGVTTVISNGVAKPALVGWAANVTRDYAVDHWDELAHVAPSERIKQLTGARFADRDAAAGRGTQIHQLAHHLALGEEVEVPEALEGHVDAYLQFIHEWEPEELFAETVVGNRKHRYMGTLDLVCRLGDGTWLLDFKTTRSGIYPESALQLAAYAHAEFMPRRRGDRASDARDRPRRLHLAAGRRLRPGAGRHLGRRPFAPSCTRSSWRTSRPPIAASTSARRCRLRWRHEQLNGISGMFRSSGGWTSSYRNCTNPDRNLRMLMSRVLASNSDSTPTRAFSFVPYKRTSTASATASRYECRRRGASERRPVRRGAPGSRLMVPAAELAKQIAGTEFVPKSLRNNPGAIAAAILFGDEVGFGPMQSLAKIAVIEGKPALAAEAQRALILRAGHAIWIEDATTTKVTVCGRRKDSEQINRFTWTMDDAKRANLAGRPSWRMYPRQMLTARATAELARAVFADAIGGLMAIEELEESRRGPGGPSPGNGAEGTTRRTRRRSKTALAPAVSSGPEASRRAGATSAG